MKKQEIIHSAGAQAQEGPLLLRKEAPSNPTSALNHSAYFNNLNLSQMVEAPRSETVYVKHNFRFGMSSQKYATNSRREQKGEEGKARSKYKRHRSLQAQHKKMISSASVNSKTSLKAKIHNFKFMKQQTIAQTESDNAGLLLDENYNLRKEVERLQCQLERSNDLFKASQQQLYSLEIQLDQEKKQSNQLRKQVQYLQARAFDNNDRSFSPETFENYFPAQSPPQRRSSVPNRSKQAQNFCQQSKNELKEMSQKIDEVLREKKRVEEFYQIYSINERLTERVNALEEINATLKQALLSKDTIISKGESQFKELKESQSVLQKENETVRTQYIQSRAVIDQIITAITLFDKGTINSSKLSKMLHRTLNLSTKGLSTTASQIDHKIPADLESHYSKASRMPTMVAPSLVGDHASYTSSESGHDVSRIQEHEQETARSVSPHLMSNYNSQQERKPRFVAQASMYSNYQSDEDELKRSSHFISLEKQLKDKMHYFPRTPLSQKTPLACKSPCSQFLINSRYGDTQVERSSDLLSRNNIDATNFMSFGRMKKDQIEEEEKLNTSEDQTGGLEMTPQMGSKLTLEVPSQPPVSKFNSELMQLAIKELTAEQLISSNDIQDIRDNFRDFKFDKKLKDSKLYILMSLLYKKIETISKKQEQAMPALSMTPDQMVETVYTKTSENSSVPQISGLKNLEQNLYRSSFQDSQKRLGHSIMASLFTPRIVAKGRALLAPQSIVAKIVQTTKESIDQEREMAKTVH